MHRIAITGIGAVTPMGNTFRASWEAACSHRSGIAPVTRVSTARIPWKVCGELKHFDPAPYLSAKEILRLDPFAQYAVAAANMAAEDAGLVSSAPSPSPSPSSPRRIRPSADRGEGKNTAPPLLKHLQLVRGGDEGEGGYSLTNDRLNSYLNSGGVIIGSSRGGIGTIERALSYQLSVSDLHSKTRRLSPYLMPSTTISMAASYTAQKLGIRGYCLGISNACSSGTNAIGEAYRLIRAGFAGPVIAGGTDAPVCRTCLEGYGAAGALSKIHDQTASRPFERNRDGFVLSEGACVIVVEEYHTALKRGAKIYAELIGYGNSVDAFHQTRPLAEGEARAMSSALSSAGIMPEQVDMISSHGTSTPVGDIAESQAIHHVFGEKAARIPVVAVKSMSGHMLAASGAFETACTAMAISQGTIFPTINLHEQDNNIELSIVREKTAADIRVAMVNSFGFGGVNAVLVLKKHY